MVVSMSDSSLSEAPSLVLASASPRRRELLRYLTPSFEMIATEGETSERALPIELLSRLPAFPLDSQQHPTLAAWRKLMAAVDAECTGIILAADTIVTIDGQVLGKPVNSAHARAMLRQLSGRIHTVYTGIAALHMLHDELIFTLDAADVQIAPLSDREIAEYVETGEPMDKAGAYGAQGLGGQLVQSVRGSFTCVVGLPLGTTYQVLKAMGVDTLADPNVAFERWLASIGREHPVCTAP
jgi:septum formation protein